CSEYDDTPQSPLALNRALVASTMVEKLSLPPSPPASTASATSLRSWGSIPNSTSPGHWVALNWRWPKISVGGMAYCRQMWAHNATSDSYSSCGGATEV